MMLHGMGDRLVPTDSVKLAIEVCRRAAIPSSPSTRTAITC